MKKAFKYRIYPTVKQARKLNQAFGCARFSYNWGLGKQIEKYELEEKKYSQYDLRNLLTAEKNQNEKIDWMKKISAHVPDNAIANLERAYQNFFRRIKNGEKPGFPKFKKKYKSRPSAQYTQHVKVDFGTGLVYIPRIGYIKAVLHRKFTGKVKTCTLSRESTDKYFISILVDDHKPEPAEVVAASFDGLKCCGIDLGIKDLVITSEGKKYEFPGFLSKSLKKLKKLQRTRARKYEAAKKESGLKWPPKSGKLIKVDKKISDLHFHIKKRRENYLHEISNEITRDFDLVAVETLRIQNMAKNSRLARRIMDAGWGELVRQIEYKCRQRGKIFVKISQWAASSKTCSECGYKLGKLSLGTRQWVCPDCGADHDRDVNAAKNILFFGKEILIGKCTPELKPSEPNTNGSVSQETTSRKALNREYKAFKKRRKRTKAIPANQLQIIW